MAYLTLTGACLSRDRRRWSGFGRKIWHNALQFVPAVLWTWAKEVRGVNKPDDSRKTKSTIHPVVWWHVWKKWREYQGKQTSVQWSETWRQNGGPVNRFYQQEVTNKSKLKENNERSQHDDKWKPSHPLSKIHCRNEELSSSTCPNFPKNGHMSLYT